MKKLRNLWRDTGGVAAIEFALMTTAFFVTFLGVLDFGTYFVQDARLTQAISDKVNNTFKNRDAVDLTEAGIQTYIRQSTGTNATVTVTCNGGTSNTTCDNTLASCKCLSSSGTFATAASCGTACTGTGYSSGAVSGYYVKINATHSFPGMILLKNSSISRAVTVRLK